MRSLFRHRDFRLLLAGQSASTLGDRLVFVALALLPLGYVLAGPLGEAFGAVEVLAVGGAIGLAALAASLLSRDVWNLSSKVAAASP